MRKRGEVDRPTQRDRAAEIMAQLSDLYPSLGRLKDELAEILDDAQCAPPQGASDGSIGEVEFNQIRGVEKGLRDFLVAMLFVSKLAATKR